MLRWEFIKKEGLLHSNMSKSFQAEEYLGFTVNVYLTTDPDEAVMYGLNKSLQDMEYLDLDGAVKTMKLNSNYRDPVVIGINTYKLGDHLEIDPKVNESLVKHIHNLQNKNTQWYTYKGDIKLKHLFVCKYCPFDIFSSNIKNELMRINEEKLHASQLIMEKARLN